MTNVFERAVNKIEKIEFQLITSCNMKCEFCFNGENISSISLSPKIICDAVDNLNKLQKTGNPYVDLKSVWLTGGEPLMVKKAVLDIIKKCKLLGVSSGLCTNGLLLDEALDDLLKAGLGEVRISMDTVDQTLFEELRGKNNSFVKIFNNIKSAVDSGIKTGVRITVTNKNLHTLEDTVIAMSEIGVSTIQIKPVIPVGCANFAMMPDHMSLKDSFDKAVRIVQSNEKYREKTKITIMCNYLPKCRGFIVLPNSACDCTYSAVCVSANGTIIPCSYYPRRSDFNIHIHSILDAWKSNFFENIRKKPEKCVVCSDWELCKNGCHAILYSCGKLGQSCFQTINEKVKNLL